jgi:acyl-CoA synthetase (AMP-forming)/AMP-acid ligase II
MINAKCRQSDRPSANLQAAIRSRIRQFSDATYINIDLEGQLETERVSDIFGRALVIQNELAQLAVPGEHDVVLCMESALDLVPAAWACIFGSHNILPVHFQSSGLRNMDLASRLASLALKLSNPVLLTTNDIEPRIATYADGKFSQLLCVESRKTMLRSREVSTPSSSKTHPATCGHILVQTSGATADPKIVAITYDAYLNRLHALHGSQNVATTVLSLFPFESVGGLSSLLWPRTARNCYLQPERLARSPLELLRIVEKFQIERLSLTSSLAAKLIDAIDRNGHSFDLSHLTTLGFGAEQIIPEIVNNLCRRLAGLGASDLKVVTGYGMTETGLVCYDSPRPWEQAFRGTYSPVPVGTSAPGYALRR